MSDDLLLLLLATRLRSRAPAPAIEETFRQLGGATAFDVAAALDEAEERGQVRRRGDEERRSLTAAGEAELAAYVARATDAAGRAEISTAYEAFLPLNRAFLGTLATPAPDVETLQAVRMLVEAVEPALAALTACLPRFAQYEGRFSEALHRGAADPQWISAPGVDSIHTVWFELHEHLLVSLGRDRSSER